MASRPSRSISAPTEAPARSEPSEFVRSVDQATNLYLAALARSSGGRFRAVPAAVAHEAQHAVGNRATARLLEPDSDEPAQRDADEVDRADERRRKKEEARKRDRDGDPRLRDPDEPNPADPPEEGDLEDEQESQDDEPPPHDDASPEDAGAVPPEGGGGTRSAPAAPAPITLVPGGGASAMAQAAAQTAAQMPGAPAGRSAAPAPSRAPARRQAPTRRRIAGPPPVPMADPDFAGVRDPIRPSTEAIEAVAARTLPVQQLPPVPQSPGENSVTIPDRAISAADMRLVEMGEPAMDRAQLSRAGDPPMPGEREGGETRTRLLGIRGQLLNPASPDPAAAPDTATPAPPATAHAGPPAPRPGAEAAHAEEVVPDPSRIDPLPLPPADVTVAEQEMFTAVIANLKAGGEHGAKRILNDIKRDIEEYPGGVLTRDDPAALDNLGHDLLPELEQDMDSRVDAVANVLGTAGAVLDAAVARRREALEATDEDRAAQTAGDARLELQTVAATTQTRLDDAAAARAQAAEARRRAAAIGRAPDLGFRQIAEAAVQRIQAKVSEAIARFQFEKTERHSALDDGRTRWLSAIDLAVLADQFDAEREQNLTPGATHPPDMSASARRTINNAINRAQAWRTEQVTFIDGAIRDLKAAMDTETDNNIRDVQAAGADAFRALRDWGSAQDGATEQWWQTQSTQLDTWADNATDTANTWAETEGRLARLQLQRAAQYARGRIERQLRGDAAELAAYQALNEAERRNFIARNIQNSDVLLRQVGAPMQDSAIEANKVHVKQTVVSQLFALPRGQWQALNAAARAKNSGFDAERSANQIIAAGVDKIGTDEAAIFRNLSGLRPIERLAVTSAYNQFRGSDTALHDDLDSELSGDEWRRAEALMSGRHGTAAAEAIHDAVFGPGTNEAQILETLQALNTLPEEERTRALREADEAYQAQYGQSLSSRLAEDLSGSQKDQALALLAGNTQEAEAHEMEYALNDKDPDAAARVFERIRSEEMVRAQREGWTPARYEAEVAGRNRRLEENFQQHYSGVSDYNWGNGSALENAIGYQFAFEQGSRDRLNSLATGDLVGVSAGRMRAEQRSTYADDEVMGNVVVDQQRYAADVVELERGPEMRRGVQQTMRLWVRSHEDGGNSLTAEQIQNHRMELEREMEASMADAAFDRARLNVGALDSRLQGRYGITLDDMITNTMSDNVFGDGGDLTNARTRLEIMRRDARNPGALADRRIDWAYSRIRHGIEGAGTDMDELRGGMSGLTQREMQRLDGRWSAEHDGETLREAIQGDTSGRDEDDLVDLFDHGAPQTVAEQVDELRRKLQRDEASVGFIGASVSEDHSARSHERLAQLEAMATRMRDPNLTPEQRENLTSSFDEQRTSVENAIEAQRARVDAYAETFTTVLSYAISAIVIAITAVLTVASGGTLSFALAGAIALAGSLIGTVSGIAAKAAIKGGAYGMEEIGTDIAVGVVDLAVQMATAGLFKGGNLLGNARALVTGAIEEVKAISRQSIRMGLKQVGAQVLRAGLGQAEHAVARTAGTQAAESGLRRMAREFAVDQMKAIPAVLTANVLNEENWRHGNVAGNILSGTWEGSLQSIRDAAIMGVASHGLTHGLGRIIHTEPLTPIQVHERDLRHWRHENLDASPGEYAAFVESYIAANSEYGDAIRAAQREARRALLSEIPPRERAAVADVPIVHVNETQFRQYNEGNFGDAFVHVQDGQAVIIVRDGAPASAIARIGPELRDIVAPGTRGRTVNPAESLPPRLRNRVPVEVIRDPSFGADEVRAVPRRDRAGNIVGVELQVGPNARAIDIRMHVDTVDAMRRYVGLAGDVRQFMNRVGRRLGMDIIDPSQRGRWEAHLEIAKLPAIIDERISRLAERGLDPRRRALVMEEIANLERQFTHEVERAQMGEAAQERGYVAAKPDGELSTTDRSRLREIMEELRGEHARVEAIYEDIRNAQPTGFTEAPAFVETNYGKYRDALYKMRRGMPPEVRRLIDRIGETSPRDARALAALHAELFQHPRFVEAAASLGKLDRQRFTSMGERLATIEGFHQERTRLEALQRQSRENVARLQQEYRDIGGEQVLGVELHPDLPEPSAPPGYSPEAARLAKFQEKLGDAMGLRLMRAIQDVIYQQDSTAFDTLARDPTIAQALGQPSLDHVLTSVMAHVNGYRAELALAGRIADGIPGLPGSGKHVVVDFGDPIGANNADTISVDADGNVFLWDSKYRTEGSASPHSETFTDGERRRQAMEDARIILNDPSRTVGLSPEALARARANIAVGTFYCVTSHTNDVFNFSHSKPLRVVDNAIQP